MKCWLLVLLLCATAAFAEDTWTVVEPNGTSVTRVSHLAFAYGNDADPYLRGTIGNATVFCALSRVRQVTFAHDGRIAGVEFYDGTRARIRLAMPVRFVVGTWQGGDFRIPVQFVKRIARQSVGPPPVVRPEPPIEPPIRG